jgi:asparagine synthase (glutamine-hydrolysing)
MCGICGQYNFKNSGPVNREVIGKMTNTIVHRGPDDEGFYISGPLGFGFRRLSIIDLTGGHQPMSDQEKSVWIIFNGEIYNYPELREELVSFGHVFQTRSDTEVIIHGYKQWGEDVFNHLNGMFGVAIWDERQRKLILARDPMGIKLIYYKIDSGSVYFGSEIRPVLAVSREKPEVDPVALNLFLRYRYTPSPLTIFKGIRKLAPGTMLIFENNTSRLKRWYKYKPVPFSPMPTVDQAKEELLEIYKRAVKRHLLSDVPVGLLLSGGMDSGLLLGLMNRQGNSWPTYTVGYGKSYKEDELSYAAETARIFSSSNAQIMLDRETFESALPRIVSFLEEPIASSSIVPMYFVCERARQDVKVALVGQGPDELFGGYTRHWGVHYGESFRKLPNWVKTPINSIINSLPRNEALKRAVYSLDVKDRMKRYQQIFSIMPGAAIDALFYKDMLPADAGDAILDCWSGLGDLMEDTDELGGFQLLEMRSSLPDELLMYADKLSMAHGLEVRVPYLDREVVEYVQRLSARFKVRHGSRKWLHKQVCRDFLPPEIINRKKRGFAVTVVDEWFHTSVNSKMDGLFLDDNSLMFKYLQPDSTRRLYHDHAAGKNDNHKLLFSLVVFEEWLRTIWS